MTNEQYYEVYKKNPVKEFYKIIDVFAGYSTTKESKYTRTITYYDTPDDLLRSSNIILSTDAIAKNSSLILERDIEDLPNKKFIIMFETYRLTKEIHASENPTQHLDFLSMSLPRLFTEPLTIDPDYIFKQVTQKMIIKLENQDFKMVNAKGFKAILTIEQATFSNVITKRENYVTFLRIREEEDSQHHEYFEELQSRLLRQCKFILAIDESKYKQSYRMTQKIEKKKQEDEE